MAQPDKQAGLRPAIHRRMAAIMASCRHSELVVLDLGNDAYQPCYVCREPGRQAAFAQRFGGDAADPDAVPVCLGMHLLACPHRDAWDGPEAIDWRTA